MKRVEERRNSQRVAVLRPIYYLGDRSDNFTSATMLNFSPTGACIQSSPPLTPGGRIYIITEEKSAENYHNASSKVIVGKVIWCRCSAGAYRLGVQYIGDPFFSSDKEKNCGHTLPSIVPSINIETFELQERIKSFH